MVEKNEAITSEAHRPYEKISKMKMKNRISIFAVIALLLASCGANVKYAERMNRSALQQAPYDVIIVPGVPYLDESFSAIMMARILWSKYLVDSGYAKHVIYSGAAVGTPYYEGIIMKTYADSLGINPKITFPEIRAEHSTENAYYGMKMAQKMGFKKIALATDPFQVKMVKSFLKKRCENMSVIPIIFPKIDPNQKRQFPMLKIDPKDAYVPNFIPLSDRQGFFERFNGTLGNKIDFDKP